MRPAFLLQASIVVSFLAGSSAPTPLYAVYQTAWGFSPITITVVFGIYALAVLATLLVFGSLSDHVGRKPVLFVTALMQAAAMAVFILARGVPDLVLARIVQGLATGAATSAAGAGMIDVDRERGTAANGFVPMLGTGAGGVVAGLFVQYLPAPTKLVFAVLGIVFLAQAAGVLAMPESVKRAPGALASLRPHVRVPPRLRSAVLRVAPALVGAWALVGFYGALGPTLVRRLVGPSLPALGGLALFVLAVGGVLAVLASRRRPPHVAMVSGASALGLGVATTIGAVSLGSAPLFFLATAVAGAGFGASFHGAIRSVMGLAVPHERAGVLSTLYVVSYLALGLPAVLAGLRVVHGGGIVVTAREYGVAVMLLAAAALGGALRGRRGEPVKAGAPQETVDRASSVMTTMCTARQTSLSARS